VPIDLVYGPGAPAGIALPELLTSGAVMDAFRPAVSSPACHQEAEMSFYRLRFRKDHRRMAGTKSAEQLPLGE
jgi:hypothetical protein